MTIHSCVLTVCLSILTAAACTQGQTVDAGPGRAGSFVLGIDQKIGGSTLATAQRQAALAIADKLRAILQRDQAVASPIGYSMRINRVFGRVTDWASFDSGLPFFAGAVGKFFAAAEKPSPTAFSGPDFGIYVNTALQCPIDDFSPPGANGKPWLVNGNLPVLQGGRHTGDFRGYPIYDGQCVIIGRSNQPPFVPLTREQYLQFEIAGFKDRLQSMNKQFSGQSLDPAVAAAVASVNQQINDAIAQLQQQLDGMDAADRGAPAAVQTGYAEAELVGLDQDGAYPLSVPNPAFFDHSLPATTVQSVAVYVPFLQSGDKPAWIPSGLSDDWRPAGEKIRDQLDWAALAALVH